MEIKKKILVQVDDIENSPYNYYYYKPPYNNLIISIHAPKLK